jgi:hypothetical protein
MEELIEILDLGDAMTETRCYSVTGPTFDAIYGPGRWTC